VVDVDMNDCAPGLPGEIVHRSSQLLLGYWGMLEEIERAFEGGWFHSGDIGTMDAEDFITVVDRVKDLINTNNILVSSREVEEACSLIRSSPRSP
jgi:fatty-acyl-CoA synthase